jgi:hypothetical protein
LISWGSFLEDGKVISPGTDVMFQPALGFFPDEMGSGFDFLIPLAELPAFLPGEIKGGA